ncbi:hypothetical protein [Escherichia coli]|uniref:hypothetical protein n=1 Tax=Escherichia coli TaxID=562 RepID=UPI001485BF94|nr:hypothetical protein [Escherichia coli]EHK6819630.1 hypothetical protein [Escherichia coli]MDS1573897.1 hypothetical protein [Escherichia coli]
MNVKPENLRHQPLKHKFNPVLSWRTFLFAILFEGNEKSFETYRSGELILTHFSGEPLVAHTNDRRLTMVDLFCCIGAIAGQVPAAGYEALSRVIVQVAKY